MKPIKRQKIFITIVAKSSYNNNEYSNQEKVKAADSPQKDKGLRK